MTIYVSHASCLNREYLIVFIYAYRNFNTWTYYETMMQYQLCLQDDGPNAMKRFCTSTLTPNLNIPVATVVSPSQTTLTLANRRNQKKRSKYSVQPLSWNSEEEDDVFMPPADAIAQNPLANNRPPTPYPMVLKIEKHQVKTLGCFFGQPAGLAIND